MGLQLGPGKDRLGGWTQHRRGSRSVCQRTVQQESLGLAMHDVQIQLAPCFIDSGTALRSDQHSTQGMDVAGERQNLSINVD